MDILTGVMALIGLIALLISIVGASKRDIAYVGSGAALCALDILLLLLK